ncbi:MAG: N-acetylglucosamine-6-phosphate deacetylase [Deltaproteobacteria bacterium]|nr:N-acetylglucosamine-6-phosphate deacetylase [Deltaproteobacteria bacterium]
MSSNAQPQPAPLTVDAFALRGRLVRGSGEPIEGAIVIDGGKVVAIESPIVAARLPRRCLDAPFIAPGFVDLQVNGGFGFEVAGDPAALRALAARLPQTGVTSFLPTLVSATERDYERAFAAFREAANAKTSDTSVTSVTSAVSAVSANSGQPSRGARMLGLHLEGPLLSPARAGAHDPAIIEAATRALVERLADPQIVRLITLAPERSEALALIALLKARGITVALGHTDASFAAFTAGVDAGATLATHVFNAMSAFHHRAPGATGAALTDDRVTALMIADGVHTHPAAFQLAARAKGLDRLGLVTDAMAGAGLPPGLSTLGGRAVIVDATSARLVEGDGRAATLAGSTLTMDKAVRNALTFAGLTPAQAIYMATEIPARAADLAPQGRLTVGAPADVVLLDEDLVVSATFVGGVLVYSHDPSGASTRPLRA